MKNTVDVETARKLVESAFDSKLSIPIDLDVRHYPEEIIFVVRVPSHALADAAIIGNEVDVELERAGFDGFVTVRALPADVLETTPIGQIRTLEDPRVEKLLALVVSRARTSETQPSLSYIRDAAANI
jgi:hypothetical protein